MSTGAHFGPSAMNIGMQLEDREYERWKDWALKQIALMEQRQAAMYTGGVVESDEMAPGADPVEPEAGLEEESGQIPATGQSALSDFTVRA